MASSQARNYTQLTLKRLFGLSGNQCAFPTCTVIFLNSGDETNYSNICHIEDANQDSHKKDRYNPNMTDKERAHYDNLILLCPVHHIETNNPDNYGVSDLREMKRSHEMKMLQSQSGTNLISKNPSALSAVVNLLGNKLFEKEDVETVLTAPNPENKITHNNVVIYKPIIEEYRVYQGKLNKIYEEIEKQGSSRKEFVLKNINSIYLKEKGKYLNFDDIKNNADNIISEIENQLMTKVTESASLDEELPVEAVQISVLVVLVDAFMRCEILEEPN